MLKSTITFYLFLPDGVRNLPHSQNSILLKRRISNNKNKVTLLKKVGVGLKTVNTYKRKKGC